jgi:hypothetical protein
MDGTEDEEEITDSTKIKEEIKHVQYLQQT